MIRIQKHLVILFSILVSLATPAVAGASPDASPVMAILPAAQPAKAQVVSPGLCRIKTDMELQWANGILVNYHSRTRLAEFSHIPGGITPATVRLQGGTSSVQLTGAWEDYVERINNRNQVVINYLFHKNSGWQNSSEFAHVEQLVFENQWVNVLRISGQRAYVQTFFLNEKQPLVHALNDPREQLFTIVTRDDKIIGSPKGDARIILIAKAREQLWIPTSYLACSSRLPKTVMVRTYPNTLNLRSLASIASARLGAYPPGKNIVILETAVDASRNVWGRTDLGWVALSWSGQMLTDWTVSP